MQITRRDMLVRSGVVVAALALDPLVKAASDLIPMPINITTKEGRDMLSYMCQTSALPKTYPMYEWPNIVKRDPRAFSSYGVNYQEEFAKSVIIYELVGRSKDKFLDQLQNDLPEFYPIDVEIRLSNYLQIEAERILDEMRGIPIPGTIREIPYYHRIRSDYIRNLEGIFTAFTEKEAQETVEKLSQIPIEKIYKEIKEYLGRYTNCIIFSDKIGQEIRP